MKNKTIYPIELDDYEKRWIKMCKGHYKDMYVTTETSWVGILKPMFEAIYGWNPNEFYHDFLNTMFNRLLDIYLKIRDDGSGMNIQLKSVFAAAFGKTISRTDDLPIERCIAELCGQIQCTTVMEDGKERFNLKTKT